MSDPSRNNDPNSVIYKFISPILITVTGFLLWQQIAGINKSVEILNDRFSAQAERITRTEGRVDGVSDRLTGIDTRMGQMFSRNSNGTNFSTATPPNTSR